MKAIIKLLLLSLCGLALCETLDEPQRARGDRFMSYASDFTQDYEPYVYAALPLHPPMPVLHVISPKPLTSLKRDIHHASSKHRPIYAKPSFSHSDYGRQSYSQSEFARPSYDQYDISYARPSNNHNHANYHPFSFKELEVPKPSYTHSEYVRPTYAELYAESLYSRPDSQLSLAESAYLPVMHPSSVSHLTYVKPPHGSLPYSAGQESAPTILYAKPTAQGGYSYNKEPTKRRKVNSPKKKSPKREPPMIIRLHKYRVTRNR